MYIPKEDRHSESKLAQRLVHKVTGAPVHINTEFVFNINIFHEWIVVCYVQGIMCKTYGQILSFSDHGP